MLNTPVSSGIVMQHLHFFQKCVALYFTHCYAKMCHVIVLYFVYLNQTMINSYDKNNFVFH